MSFSVLQDDLRALASYHLYSSSSANVTSNVTGSGTIASNIVQTDDSITLAPDLSPEPQISRKANATLVFLARNSDLQGVLKSMESVETHFNQRFGYPWIFLNEDEFTNEFKE